MVVGDIVGVCELLDKVKKWVMWLVIIVVVGMVLYFGFIMVMGGLGVLSGLSY